MTPADKNTENVEPHPYAVPERLIKGPINPLVTLADVGRLPKDYRSRLMRRALAESSEPTLTPNELMGRIRSRESRVGGSQWRLHIQVPGEAEGHPVVGSTPRVWGKHFLTRLYTCKMSETRSFSHCGVSRRCPPTVTFIPCSGCSGLDVSPKRRYIRL